MSATTRRAVATATTMVLLAAGLAQQAAARPSWSAAIPTHAGANYLACPSARQCTAIALRGTTYTFDPASPASPPVQRKYDIGYYDVSGLTCLSVSSCVAVSDDGDELTFDPMTGTALRNREVRNYVSLSGVYCLALTDCLTASRYGTGGGYYTFDASSVDANPHAHRLPHQKLGYTALTCPTHSECVAIIENGGWASTFAPGRSATRAYRINRGSHLNAIACPRPVECVAVNSAGSAITFDPKAPRPVVRGVDSHDLNGIACSSASFCAAADRDGRVVYGKPGRGRWTVTAVPGAQRLETIAYAGSHRFVVVDSAGNAYVATLR